MANGKATQNDLVLAHLKQYGSITPIEAIDNYRIMRLASRISDLHKMGHKIHSELITEQKQGYTVRYSRYTLAEEQGVV